ncbi:hypothetical protein BofuT4_uP098300.1 [Botrytis cinerea T4]|uniref:Uncharacterized protein n=1 Tax=Botryotinia fuckeliana (strain T4) TaxID=999810 RepID=G2YCM5_BOTF4|nr:hypothetical protein BofuT4_uP098300.1 [Botrytis cinerea T4]
MWLNLQRCDQELLISKVFGGPVCMSVSRRPSSTPVRSTEYHDYRIRG